MTKRSLRIVTLLSGFFILLFAFSPVGNVHAQSIDSLLNAYKGYITPKPLPVVVTTPPTQTTVSSTTILSLLRSLLNRDDIRNELRGPAGLTGATGATGLTGATGATGSSGGFAPLSPPSWAPTSNTSNQIIGSSGGYASLGVQDLNATDVRITGNLIQSGGSASLLGLTATGLTVNGSASITGTLTAGSIVGALTGNASTVTTNANLTGPITSVGNATSIASQTGTGTTFVMNTSPTLVTPVLGVASATSINGLTITSSTGTLTVSNTKTLTASDSTTFATNSITLGGGGVITFSASNALSLLTTGSTSVTLPTSGTLYGTATGSITSLQLLTSLSDETGSGAAVFATSPTFTTSALFPLGSVGAPGISFTGDTNNGIWSSAADTLNFSTAGAERVRIDSSGNVGIGTTGPGFKLDVNGQAALGGGATRVYVFSDGGYGYVSQTASGGGQGIAFGSGGVGLMYSGGFGLYLNTSGNVGIGTTGPTAKIDISSDGTSVNRFIGLNDTAASGRSYGIYNRLSGTAGLFGIYDNTAGAARLTISSTGVIGVGVNTVALQTDGNQSLYLGSNGSTKVWLDSGSSFAPVSDNSINNGRGDLRWTAVYAVNGTIQTSDLREKHNIFDTELGLGFINKLRPVRYEYNDIGGIREGFIAQEVLAALEGQPFEGGLIYSIDTDRYGLNYAAFVAPLAKAVQQLDIKITGVEERLSLLEANVGGSGTNFGQIAIDFFTSGIQSVVDGIAYMKGIVTEKLTVGSSELPTGVTVYDRATKEPRCISSENGILTNTPGECVATPPPSEPEPIPPPSEPDPILPPAEEPGV